MSRWLLASMVVGAGITWAAIAPAPARADEKGTQSGSSRGRNDEEGGPAKRIDKAIEDFEGRADEELNLTRKEIERLRKEYSEMNNLYFDMVVSLAELQAETRVQSAQDNDSDGNRSSDSGQGSSASEQKRLRAIELNRELRPLQDNLRNLVQQKRSEIEQLVVSLRNLRAQQRQAASDREKNKQGASESQDRQRGSESQDRQDAPNSQDKQGTSASQGKQGAPNP